MSNVLVCIKRVPDLGGEVTLTGDQMGVDDRSLGHTVSPHEECAVELAIQTAKATDGEVTILTVGPDDAVELAPVPGPVDPGEAETGDRRADEPAEEGVGGA